MSPRATLVPSCSKLQAFYVKRGYAQILALHLSSGSTGFLRGYHLQVQLQASIFILLVLTQRHETFSSSRDTRAPRILQLLGTQPRTRNFNGYACCARESSWRQPSLLYAREGSKPTFPNNGVHRFPRSTSEVGAD